MFIGIYHLAINKDKVEIPAALREMLAGRVVVTQGFERNLLVLPVDTFQNLFRLVASLNIADPLARLLQRMLLGNARYVEINANGELRLPESLQVFAQLSSDVVLVGQGNYLEAWSNPLWQQQEINLQDADANSMRFVSVNLGGI